MAELRISNTLINDTQDNIIAYCEQLKDKQISWDDEAFSDKIPDEMKTELNKFQSALNRFFLSHYAEFHRFLEDAGQKEGVIDSWYEVEEFLKNVSDEEEMSLMKLLKDNEMKNLNIRMSETTPGVLEAVSNTDFSDSYIDETGTINIIYHFLD